MTRFDRWVGCWLGLVDSLVGIVSFAHFHPGLHFSWATKCFSKMLDEHREGVQS